MELNKQGLIIADNSNDSLLVYLKNSSLSEEIKTIFKKSKWRILIKSKENE